MLHVVTFFPSWLPASSSPVAAPSLERGKLVTVAHSLTRAVVVVVVVVVVVLVLVVVVVDVVVVVVAVVVVVVLEPPQT